MSGWELVMVVALAWLGGFLVGAGLVGMLRK